MKHHLRILLWPTVVIILHIILTLAGGYYWWAHVDKFMHVLGGTSISLSGLTTIQLYRTKGELVIKSQCITIAIILSLVALAAVSWEFLEFTLDHTMGTHMQPNLVDTMGDLLAGLCGGLLITIIRLPSPTKTKVLK